MITFKISKLKFKVYKTKDNNGKFYTNYSKTRERKIEAIVKGIETSLFSFFFVLIMLNLKVRSFLIFSFVFFFLKASICPSWAPLSFAPAQVPAAFTSGGGASLPPSTFTSQSSHGSRRRGHIRRPHLRRRPPGAAFVERVIAARSEFLPP